MVVYGDRKEIEDFRRKMLEAKEKAASLDHWDLYEAYAVYGHDENWILNGCGGNGYNRGNIGYISEATLEGDGTWSLRIDYESAWSPMIDGFDYLLRKHYFTLRQVTEAEECGCDVYVNTDERGRWFTDRYILEGDGFDTEYYDASEESELCSRAAELIGEEGLAFGSFEEVEGYIEHHDLPSWMAVHEFTLA